MTAFPPPLFRLWTPGLRRAALALVVGLTGPGPALGQEGARYVKVEKIAPGRILWIRSGPGRIHDRIGFLRHDARHIRSYGCRELPTGQWCEIRHRGTRGWASGRYLTKDTARRA